MFNILKNLVIKEDGQGMAEYGLILALISIVVIVVLTAIGGRLGGVFTQVRDALPAAGE